MSERGERYTVIKSECGVAVMPFVISPKIAENLVRRGETVLYLSPDQLDNLSFNSGEPVQDYFIREGFESAAGD